MVTLSSLPGAAQDRWNDRLAMCGLRLNDARRCEQRESAHHGGDCQGRKFSKRSSDQFVLLFTEVLRRTPVNS